MGRKPGARIYWRDQGSEKRAYADFRDFADVGGKREALIPPGARRAVTDPDVAREECQRRLKAYEQARRSKALLGLERPRELKEYASDHLKRRAKKGELAEGTLKGMQRHLERAAEFFGAGRKLDTITARDVSRWLDHLDKMDNGRGGTLSAKTQREHLTSLSDLFQRAISEGVVPSGHNPARAVYDKPKPEKTEADWLRPSETALYLEAARLYKPPADKHAIPFHYPLIATFAYTGARKSAVLGLGVEDVVFDRGGIRFRPNEHRGLKTSAADREVPLWPHLREILQEYIFSPKGPKSGLLFPSHRTGKMLDNIRKTLDAIADTIGWPEKRVRTKVFRHGYAAYRIQMLENGKPIPLYNVAKELGHTSTRLIDERYGHLARNPDERLRREEMSFRLELFKKQVSEERVRALAASAS